MFHLKSVAVATAVASLVSSASAGYDIASKTNVAAYYVWSQAAAVGIILAD